MIDENIYTAEAHTEIRKDKKPVRDRTGKFVKGHEPLARPKYDLMRKFPKLLCSTCCIRHTCPECQKDYVCAFKRELKKFGTRNANEVIDMLRLTTEMSLSEMQFAMVQEIVSREYDRRASRLVSKNAKRLVLLYRLLTQIAHSQAMC